MTRKPTAKEILKGIEDSELDDEMERVLAATPEERKKDLEAAGFDVEELHAKADAVHEQMKRTMVEERAKELETKARVRSLRPPARQRPIVLWIAAAAAAAVAGGALYAALNRPPVPAPVPAPPVPSSVPPRAPEAHELVAAADLRRQAFAACDAQRWVECLTRFDEARRIDAAGDAVPEVQAARRRAASELDKKRMLP
ncbi:MAG TPA: hypothetical protein VIF09_10030 [Polyangiaceae bacterium]